jgi:hypothetical protein
LKPLPLLLPLPLPLLLLLLLLLLLSLSLCSIVPHRHAPQEEQQVRAAAGSALV